MYEVWPTVSFCHSFTISKSLLWCENFKKFWISNITCIDNFCNFHQKFIKLGLQCLLNIVLLLPKKILLHCTNFFGNCKKKIKFKFYTLPCNFCNFYQTWMNLGIQFVLVTLLLLQKVFWSIISLHTFIKYNFETETC